MEKLVIEGGQRLEGEFTAHGSKNSVLPILVAALLADGITIIHRCPAIKDVESAFYILKYLGCNAWMEGDTAYIDTTGLNKHDIPHNLMREMRSSIIFLGAIMARFGRARISFPGGCELGPRPIDIHISALTKMGVKFKDDHGYLDCTCDKLCGTEIYFDFPSVGATENILLAASMAEGTTVINNAAKEPEIEDLQNVLVKMGAKIYGAGNGRIVIEGVKKLHPAEHTVIADRIEVATYMTAAAITGGDILIRNMIPGHLKAVFSIMEEAGCTLDVGADSVRTRRTGDINAIRTIRTMPYPGFPTDVQAPMMALLSIAKGSSIIIESIFQNRFKHVGELCRMGAKISVEGRLAIIEGVPKLMGAQVMATDLRGGAALAVAALAAQGRTEISDILHIDRGYEKFEQCLAQLGANIKRVYA